MRVGSLFTGIGGLELGLGMTAQWMVEFDTDARTVLDANHPSTPVFGDVKAVDFTNLPPIDVLVGGGFPCQPFSQAGKRKGKQDDRYLWPEVHRAVDALRPRLVFLENVRGIMFPRNRQTYGEILGSLADIGYDIRWGCLRASEAGAPHRRDRWFAVAYPSGLGRSEGSGHGEDEEGGLGGSRPADGGVARNESDLLPTPVARDDGKSVEAHLEMKRNLPGGARSAITSLAVLARAGFEQPLLPTPVASDAHGSRRNTARTDEWESNPGNTIKDAIYQSDMGQDWGRYTDAIAHWEQVLGRPAPAPTIREKTLSAEFVEWMMGFPHGHISRLDSLSNTAKLKMLGNAVVPQQARLAYSLLLGT